MSKTRLERHRHYVNWRLDADLDVSYPAEAAMMDRLVSTGNVLFVPYPFKYTDDAEFHFHLAFLVEAIELMPLKIDLSFDAVWRAFESVYKKAIAPNDFKLGQESPIVAKKIDKSADLDEVLNELFSAIPMQTCEYIVKRIFDTWRSHNSDWQKIWNRLNNPAPFHSDVRRLLEKMAAKYGAPKLQPVEQRKAAGLIRIALDGKEVNVNGTTIKLSRQERISFLVNALLYTFRNDRFHGSMQPPFKSSKGSLKTYAHTHYCFLWAHLLFLYSLGALLPKVVSHALISENTAKNLEAFRELYGKVTRK